MPALHRKRGPMHEINVVPYIDVMLVLLIIFMVTAPILQSGIEVDLPKTRTVRAISEERVVVTVDKKQTVYVGNDPININRLGSAVLDRMRGEKNSPVYLRCDQAVPFGAFAKVIDSLKQAGITNINIVTEPLNTSGGS